MLLRSHGGGNCSGDGGAHEGGPDLHPTDFKITHNAAIKAFFQKLNLFCSFYKNQSINSDRLFIIKMVNEMIKVSYIFVKYNAYLVYSCSVQYAQTKRVRKLSMLLCNI